MMKKYNEFRELITEETGIRNITKIIQKHKDTGSVNFEIYFHQDLDGVCSCLSMRRYLEGYGLKLVDAHIIQYGGLEFAIKDKRPDSLAALVDYANFRTLFSIATDHHSSQHGEAGGSSHAKPSRSNVDTDIFTSGDIKLIQTVDSADFLKYQITPDDIQRAIFSSDRNLSGERNRFLMGFVVNRLLLVYKNKRISVKSLNGKLNHINKNLLECLVLDSSPSLISIYNNLKHYMNSAVSLEWDRSKRQHNTPKKLATPEEITQNLEKYIQSRKGDETIQFDDQYKIVKQYGIGSVFDSGSYDRYVVFKNNPEAEFVCTIFPMGLIQVSCNPFREKKLKGVDLGGITKEVLNKYKYQLSNINVPISDIKRISESDIDGMKKKYGPTYQGIGFSFSDLVSFYNKSIIYLPHRKSGDLKTRKNLDLSGSEDSEVIKLIQSCMNKPWVEWSQDDKREMDWFKIPVLSIIEANSGGHPSITNIQGINYLSSRRDLLKRLFGTEEYTEVMKKLADEFIIKLKEKIDLEKAGQEVVYDTGGLVLTGEITENFEYFIQQNNQLKSVTKDEFIKQGSSSHFDPKRDKINKGFSLEVKDNKVIGKFE